MKKTGLPLAYPNIPQLSRAAAFPPDTRFPRRGTGGGEPRAAARAHANEKARTHRAGLFHSVWLSPSLRQRICSIPQCLRCCQMFLTSSSLRRCRWLSLPIRASPGGGREGASLAPQRMAFPFCCGFLGGSLALMSRRAAGSPAPQAWAFPLALPFPECGAQHRACCLPLSTVLCYTWGGGVRYGKVPPHDIRRPPAP